MAKDDHGHDRAAPEGRAVAEKRPRMSRPQEVSALLASVFGGTPAARLLREIVIWQVWDDVVGPQVARRARPAAIRDGVLTVTVASGPWLQQLTFLKGEIITQLNEKVGEELVREIYLKAGNPRQVKPPAAPEPPLQHPLTDGEKEAIARQTATIKDEELRSLVAGLLMRHMAATGGRPR